MTRTGWAVVFRDPSEMVLNPKTDKFEYKQVDVPVGNYPKYGDRQLDNVMVFRGFYGVKSYMIWELHQNIGFYDFGSVLLNLRLFLEGSSKLCFWEDIYRPISIKYDDKRSMYIIYAVSQDSRTLDIPFIVESMKFFPPVKGWKILEELIEGSGKYSKVQYHEYPDKNIGEYDYALIPNMKNILTYDFIKYICDDNRYEWCVRNGVLHVGKELHAIEEMNSAFQIDIATDKVAETAFFKSYSGETIPADVLSNWNKKWRCVWVKHAAGACGGLTKCMFAKIGSKQISREMFFESLDFGKMETREGVRLLRRAPSVNMMIGNVLSDLGENEYIERVSIQRNKNELIEKIPYNIKIDRSEGNPYTQVQNQLNEASRLSPYLDENAGMLFPSQTLLTPLSHPPNCLVGFVEGKIESPVVLGFLYGNGREVSLPTKSQKEDLRLQLPNGWCLYIDGITGETFICVSGVNHLIKPTITNASIHIDAAGNITIGGPAAQLLAQANHTHLYSPGPLAQAPTGPCLQNTTRTKAA